MGNGRTRSGYVRKMTQWEALEKCSPELRKVLCGSVQNWDAVYAFKYEKKNGTRAAIRLIHLGNLDEARRPLIKGQLRGRGNYIPAQPSSFVECGVKPLLDYSL